MDIAGADLSVNLHAIADFHHATLLIGHAVYVQQALEAYAHKAIRCSRAPACRRRARRHQAGNQHSRGGGIITFHFDCSTLYEDSHWLAYTHRQAFKV
jgi:hypothetical protein